MVEGSMNGRLSQSELQNLEQKKKEHFLHEDSWH